MNYSKLCGFILLSVLLFAMALKPLKAQDCAGKQSWPELEGTDGDDATEKIEEENPEVNAFVLPEGISMTGDFRCDRVRVFVNGYGNVVGTPKVG